MHFFSAPAAAIWLVACATALTTSRAPAADTPPLPASSIEGAVGRSLDEAPGLDLAGFAHWKFESLKLRDPDRTLSGMIVAADGGGVDFMEIRQPPGRPMFMVMHWRYPRDQILEMKELPPAEHQQLAVKIDDFKNRRRAEELGWEKIELERRGSPAGRYWRYTSPTWLLTDGRSPWLIVESTADEETTRRSIARIEQVCSAYREILPPRVKPSRALTVKLFGTMNDYFAYIQAEGLRLQNPAVFIAEKNYLAAGSELAAYSLQMAAFRKHCQDVRQELAAQVGAMQAAVGPLRQQLTAAGYTPDEIRRIVQAAQARSISGERAAEIEQQLKVSERHNLRAFDEVTKKMFQRLFHEAFHAYLENYVYPSASRDVPRWLNEGLAQIFESGQLESGTLRLDAPDAERLKELQADLRTQPRLPLAELLAAAGSRFLVDHAGGESASKRYYLYSWGLAYYLAFRQPLLETAALDRYVNRAVAATEPAERLEKLVGLPLDKFESRWRNAMLRMKSDGK